jgi:hypothetical protein
VSSYIILSDFDTLLSKNTSLPKSTSLIGLWSANGDFVRYSNGVRYYDNWTSVSSARNDSVAEQFDFPYTVVKSLDNFSPQKNIFGGVHLPLSQQLFLYVLLGVFIILALFI